MKEVVRCEMEDIEDVVRSRREEEMGWLAGIGRGGMVGFLGIVYEDVREGLLRSSQMGFELGKAVRDGTQSMFLSPRFSIACDDDAARRL
jgi:hypothetical protein